LLLAASLKKKITATLNKRLGDFNYLKRIDLLIFYPAKANVFDI
jgi:hypothetical protein